MGVDVVVLRKSDQVRCLEPMPLHWGLFASFCGRTLFGGSTVQIATVVPRFVSV